MEIVVFEKSAKYLNLLAESPWRTVGILQKWLNGMDEYIGTTGSFLVVLGL
jgi:hypothetical protein